MKTYTLEELRLAQAKGCRVQSYDEFYREWINLNTSIDEFPRWFNYKFRIHPADEWKARLPRLKEGAEWACDGSGYEQYRPHIIGELTAPGEIAEKGYTQITSRPVPPEFLHTDELAEAQTCAIQHNQENAKNLRDPKGFCKVCGTDWPEVAQAPDFGEPWRVQFDAIRDRGEYYVTQKSPATAARMVACVNALAGVPNPAEFVRQAIAAEARLAEALGTCAFKDWFKSQQTGQISVVLDAVKVREALAAYEAHKKGNTL